MDAEIEAEMCCEAEAEMGDISGDMDIQQIPSLVSALCSLFNSLTLTGACIG
jgi:hypothetical protein